MFRTTNKQTYTREPLQTHTHKDGFRQGTDKETTTVRDVQRENKKLSPETVSLILLLTSPTPFSTNRTEGTVKIYYTGTTVRND